MHLARGQALTRSPAYLQIKASLFVLDRSVSTAGM
jgi:hypothetical protein